MAGLTTPITTTAGGTIETALVKNPDGSAIASPVYVDCTANGTAANGQKQWICAVSVPASASDTTYPIGAQKYRVKGSAATSDTALSGNAVTVPGTGASPSYDTTLSATQPAGTPGTAAGVVFAPASSQRLRFNGNPNTAGNTAALQITDSSDNSVSYLSIPDDYRGMPFAFDRANGTTYTGTFATPLTDFNFTA